MTSSNIIRMSHLQGNYMASNLALSFKSQRTSAAHSRATSQEGPIFQRAQTKNMTSESGQASNASNTATGRVSLGAVLPSVVQRQQPLLKIKTSTHSRESSLHK
jgi:hypothetical protein